LSALDQTLFVLSLVAGFFLPLWLILIYYLWRRLAVRAASRREAGSRHRVQPV